MRGIDGNPYFVASSDTVEKFSQPNTVLRVALPEYQKYTSNWKDFAVRLVGANKELGVAIFVPENASALKRSEGLAYAFSPPAGLHVTGVGYTSHFGSKINLVGAQGFVQQKNKDKTDPTFLASFSAPSSFRGAPVFTFHPDENSLGLLVGVVNQNDIGDVYGAHRPFPVSLTTCTSSEAIRRFAAELGLEKL